MILTLLNNPPRETTYSNEIVNSHDIENEYAPLDQDEDSVLGMVATLNECSVLGMLATSNECSVLGMVATSNECSVLGMMATMLPKTFWSSFPLLLVTIVPVSTHGNRHYLIKL
jgi:hypothetical protein